MGLVTAMDATRDTKVDLLFDANWPDMTNSDPS